MTELTFDSARIVNEDGVWLCLKVKDPAPARAFVYGFKGVHTAILKRFQKKRSLDANAYAWALLGKLSTALRIPKEEIYRCIIKEIGGNYEILPIRNDAVQAFKERWEYGRVGWIVEELGDSITQRERELLPVSVLMMTLECGIRFLADHINGDVYFSIHREGHNLDRCRTQFKLVAEIEEKFDEMAAIVAKY